MKKSFITVALLVSGFFISSTLLTGCSNKAKEDQNDGDEHAEMKKDSVQSVAYACPMHPEITGKEGDKCTKCNMKLEAVKKTDSAAEHHH
jgi:hypothetical protein